MKSEIMQSSYVSHLIMQAKKCKLAKVAGGQGAGGQGASMRTQNMYA